MRLGLHFPSTARVPQSNTARTLRRPKPKLAPRREDQVAAHPSNMPSPWASIEEFVNAARIAGAL